MSKATTFFAFVAGAAIGVGATWGYFKTKYERIAQEEIDSVKETFSKRAKPEETPKESEDDNRSKARRAREKADIMEYAARLAKEGYTNYGTAVEDGLDQRKNDQGEEARDLAEPPYVITPEQYGDQVGYDAISLTYYADGVLADDDDVAMEEDDIDNAVGADFYTHFGENKDDEDVIHIRNDRLKCDYEICRDYREYAEVLEKAPYQAGV